jgi:hypothetical protein
MCRPQGESAEAFDVATCRSLKQSFKSAGCCPDEHEASRRRRRELFLADEWEGCESLPCVPYVDVQFNPAGAVDASGLASIRANVALAAGVNATAVMVQATSERVTVTVGAKTSARAIVILDGLSAALSSTADATALLGVPVEGTPSVAIHSDDSVWLVTGSTAAPTVSPTSSQPTACSAAPDLDGDGAFRLADAVYAAEVWAGVQSWAHELPCRDGDYDGDGTFRLADAAWLAEVWRSGARDIV